MCFQFGGAIWEFAQISLSGRDRGLFALLHTCWSVLIPHVLLTEQSDQKPQTIKDTSREGRKNRSDDSKKHLLWTENNSSSWKTNSMTGRCSSCYLGTRAGGCKHFQKVSNEISKYKSGGSEPIFIGKWPDLAMIEGCWRRAMVLFPSCCCCLCVWMDLQWGTQDKERRGEREGDKSGLLHCYSRVGDILKPSMVYTDHKHLGSKAE